MGKKFSLVCVAEGAKPEDGEMVVKGKDIKGMILCNWEELEKLLLKKLKKIQEEKQG
jgi:hypothetical protein